MINSFFKKFFSILVLFFITENLSYSKIDLKILFKINDEIITNIDLNNEEKFLILLNPKLINLSKSQIRDIAENSVINRKIKEIELLKYIDLNQENLGDEYISNFINQSNFINKNHLIDEIKKNNLEFKYLEKNFVIDNLWREFVFNKFSEQVKVDIDNLKKQVQDKKNEVEEINLSEILFEVFPNSNLEQSVNKIYSEIERSGFEAAATMYSISSSKNFGGKLGWVKSNQLSEKIYLEISKGKDLTSPINTGSGYLIIKVNEKRKSFEKIDFDRELKKLVSLETEKELNKLGYIYFNKIKKRTFINEN